MKDTLPPCPVCLQAVEDRKFRPFCSSVCSDADLDRVRGELTAGLEALAETLLGAPSIRKVRTWRWGKQGSLSVEVSGRKRGSWHDHEAGQGGGPLQLIAYARPCSTAEAIRWAREWTGGTPEAGAAFKAEHAARQAERDRKARAAAVDQATEEQQRTDYATRLWAQAVPVATTLAERYLLEVRQIPAPTAWPDTVRFHSATRSLIVAATSSDGAVRAVQRIRLAPDAQKAASSVDNPTKQTNGVLASAAVRLPGDPAGPLMLAEGPETGLSVWAATGHETWIMLGGMGGVAPPAGRRAVACRDDDPKHSPADRRLLKTVAEWTAAGHQVAVATPWPFRAYDKTDFNDALKQDGAAGVRQRVEASLNPGGGAPIRLPIKVVRERLRTAVTGFFDATRTWAAQSDISPSDAGTAQTDAGAAGSNQPTLDSPPRTSMPVHAIRVDVGSGKSLTALQEAIRLLTEMRAAGDGRSAAFAIPTHALGDELAAIFAIHAARRGLTAAVWRGMSAPDPDSGSDPMCLNLEAVQDARDAMLDVYRTTCRRKLSDGTFATCPFLETCGYERQRRSEADLWIIPHNLLFLEKPTAIGPLAFLVIDESIWQDGLEGVHGKPTMLALDAVEHIEPAAADAPLSSRFDQDRLQYLRNRLLDVLRPAGDGPVTAESLEMSELSLDNTREAYRLEWARFVDPGMHPGMTKAQRREAVAKAAINATIPRLATMWQAMTALLEEGGPQRSGWAALAMKPGDDGLVKVLHLKGRTAIRKGWQVPTLLLDATMNVDLVRFYLPEVELTAELLADAPHQTVRQVVDRAYSKSAIEPLLTTAPGYSEAEAARRHRGLRTVHAIINREARRYGGDDVLVVTQKAVREALPGHGPMATCIDLAHHNAVAGRDKWRNVRALIMVGRTQPAPASVERLAEALTGRAVEHLDGWYGRGDGVRHTTVAGPVAIEADRHPDLIAEAIRWQVCEGELVQINGRGRGVNRTEDNPLDVLVLTDAPLDVPVTATLQAADLAPSPNDLMLAAGGVVFENPADASAAYSQIWATKAAAKMALWKAKVVSIPYKSLLLGEGNHLRRLDYQRAGRGQQPATAWFDPVLILKPEEWLTERLGTLAWCRSEVEQPPPPSPNAEPPVRPKVPPPVDAVPVVPVAAGSEVAVWNAADGHVLDEPPDWVTRWVPDADDLRGLQWATPPPA